MIDIYTKFTQNYNKHNQNMLQTTCFNNISAALSRREHQFESGWGCQDKSADFRGFFIVC